MAATGTPVPTGVNIGEVFPLAQVFKTLGGLISRLYPMILLLAGVIFFILIIFAGIGVISGAGSDDPQAKEQAKSFLTYAVIGLIIIFGAFWIMQIINYLTGGALGGIF